MPGNPEMSPGFQPEGKQLSPDQLRNFNIKHRDAILSSDPQGGTCGGTVLMYITGEGDSMRREALLDSVRQETMENEENETAVEAAVKRYDTTIDNLIEKGVLIEEGGVLKFNVEG